MQKLKEVKLSLYKSDPEQILDELDNGNNVRIILKKKAPQ
jgi:vacuolar-type H+-ATPase subunit C/Vma6